MSVLAVCLGPEDEKCLLGNEAHAGKVFQGLGTGSPHKALQFASMEGRS
jgi:hypothetical protein